MKGFRVGGCLPPLAWSFSLGLTVLILWVFGVDHDRTILVATLLGFLLPFGILPWLASRNSDRAFRKGLWLSTAATLVVLLVSAWMLWMAFLYTMP